MAISNTAPATASLPERPAVRQIAPADLKFALTEGWRDFKSMRGDLLFAGLIYPIVGMVAAVVSLGGALIPLFFPIAAGIALLGPLTAIGFYELARRREQGLESDWSHFLDVRKRKAFPDMLGIGAILIGLFALWVAVAGGLFVALWGKNTPDSVGAFLTRLFTTKEGWELILVGNAVGALFAVAVLALSVVSLPMLVDRDGGAGTALRTSIAAFRTNFGMMVRWGLIVAALLVAGSIPAFVGLAVMLPWLGYATWHLYTRLVDRGRV